MREICTSGSEGGGAGNQPSLPTPILPEVLATRGKEHRRCSTPDDFAAAVEKSYILRARASSSFSCSAVPLPSFSYPEVQ